MHTCLKTGILACLGVQDKVRETVDELVMKGKENKGECAKLVRDVMDRVEKRTKGIDKKIRECIDKTIERINIPSKSDIEALNKRMQEIAERIRNLETGQSK